VDHGVGHFHAGAEAVDQDAAGLQFQRRQQGAGDGVVGLVQWTAMVSWPSRASITLASSA
jgi:tetrahydromethanopterin S-methyltransferase subunit D